MDFIEFLFADFPDPYADKYPCSFCTPAVVSWGGLLHWSKDFSDYCVCLLGLHYYLHLVDISL